MLGGNLSNSKGKMVKVRSKEVMLTKQHQTVIDESRGVKRQAIIILLRTLID